MSVTTKSVTTKSATTNIRSARANRALRILVATFMAAITILAISASPAGAVEGPNDFLPGGNGPDDPTPVFFPELVLAPTSPTATVEVSCTSETATVTVGNKTNNFHQITVELDGAVHDGAAIGSNQQWTSTFPVAENESVLVEVLNNTKTILAEDVTRDCLLADPSYEILTDCGIGLAHARLINSGDDVANMAVQYHPNPYALQPIAPGDTLDWPLVVEPDGTVDFTIRFGHEALGVESLDFTCSTPEPVIVEPVIVEPVIVEPVIVEPVIVEPKAVVEPEVGPGPIVDPKTAVDAIIEPEVADEAKTAEADLDDETDEDVDGLAFAAGDDTSDGDQGGLSAGRLVLIVLWSLVALLGTVAALLTWRRREDQTETLAKA